LHGLAAPKRMHLNGSRLQARVLWMRQADSWSSKVPSSTEGLMQPHLTIQMCGANFSMQQVCKADTRQFPMASSLGSMQASGPFHKPSPLPTDQPLTNTLLNLTSWCTSNFKKGAMLALSHARKLSSCWELSKPPLSVLYRSQGDRENIGSFRTSHPLISPFNQSPQSTAPSTQTNTSAHGALLPPSASSYLACPQVHRLLYAMSKRPTEPSPSSLISGQDLLFAYVETTNSRLTHGITSVWPQEEVSMVLWAMLVPRSCVPMALHPSQSGWTTMFSSASCNATSSPTTSSAVSRPRISQTMEARSMTVAAFGSEVPLCLMTCQRSSTKTPPAPSKTSPRSQKGISFLCTSSLPSPPTFYCTQI